MAWATARFFKSARFWAFIATVQEFSAPEVASSLGPHDLACQREQRAELARELEGLSIDQRHVMVMKDVLALSYEEIAEVLEMPVGTVKCHAHRGRARMRRALEPPAEAVSA